MDQLCPHCQLPLSPEMNFCPHCGKKIKEPPPSKSASEQIIVYAISLLLPPLGLWYAYKYLKHGDDAGKKIGYAAIILTLISIIFTIWLSEVLISSVNQSLQGLNF